MRSTMMKNFILAAALGIVGCNYLIPDLKNVARDAGDADIDIAGDDAVVPDTPETETDAEKDTPADEGTPDGPMEIDADPDLPVDADVDADAEDAPGEPDAPVAGGTVLLSDGGGGLAQNGQYALRGGISAVSCSESGSDSYILDSCGMQILNP